MMWFVLHICTLKYLMNKVKLYLKQMLRNMKICRVLLYLRSLSKNCLVFVFPESTVSWTGKNWKSYSVLQRQRKCQVSGQTWAVSILLAPWAACRPWWGSFHWENGASSVHQCHAWRGDERVYVPRLVLLTWLCLLRFLYELSLIPNFSERVFWHPFSVHIFRKHLLNSVQTGTVTEVVWGGCLGSDT